MISLWATKSRTFTCSFTEVFSISYTTYFDGTYNTVNMMNWSFNNIRQNPSSYCQGLWLWTHFKIANCEYERADLNPCELNSELALVKYELSQNCSELAPFPTCTASLKSPSSHTTVWMKKNGATFSRLLSFHLLIWSSFYLLCNDGTTPPTTGDILRPKYQF